MTAALYAFLGYAAFSDLKYRRIPNGFVITGIVLALGLALYVSPGALWSSVSGALVGGTMMLPFFGWKVMGGGDIKLAALIGAIAGFPGVLVAVPLGLAIGALTVTLLQAFKFVKVGDRVPLAPMLVLGAYGSFFISQELFDAWGRILVPS